MGPFFALLLIVASLIIAGKICKILNKNTVGTTGAYITRFVVVFIIVLAVLGGGIGSLLKRADAPKQSEQTRDNSTEETAYDQSTDNPSMDTIFNEAIGGDSSTPTNPSNADITEPPQEDHPNIQPDSDFAGTWVDADSMYQMDISSADGVYTIEIYQKQVDGESRQWSLEGYSEEGNGIFYSGVYVDLYLRDDGTVGGGGAPSDAAGVIFLTDDGILHWDSDTGELETAVLLTRS